jgi:hypothetical protein
MSYTAGRLAAFACALVLSVPAAAQAGRAAYFVFDYPPAPERFVIQLNRPEQIAHARRILSGEETEAVHVMGKVLKRSKRWNAPWSFHLAPKSIEFFAFAIEVCDASIQYVEEHLDEVGGAFLPGSVWCPWGSRLLEEIPRP